VQKLLQSITNSDEKNTKLYKNTIKLCLDISSEFDKIKELNNNINSKLSS